VASSKIKILGFLAKILAKIILCLWPPDKSMPLSPITVENLSGKSEIKSKILAILELFEKLKLQNQLYWRGMTRASIIADKCSDEDLSILAQSGCWRIAMGVESGDEQILRRIKKGITTHQVREAVSKLRAVGIPQVKAFFIMGFPEETLEQMETTRKFIMELKQLGLTDISIFQFKPYPGTEEWQHLQQTNPEVLENLYYIRHGGSTNIVNRKIAKDASLPDDLKIAAVPSKIVREMVVKTLEEFYGH